MEKNKTKISRRIFSYSIVIMCLLTYCFGSESVNTQALEMQESIETATGSPYYNEDYANQVLTLVNKERASNGLSPLTMDAGLVSSAKIRATEIRVSFSHTRPDGTSCFTAFPSSQTTMGENIASGYSTPNSVMNGWMNSSGHRANILNSSFKSIGITCYYVTGSTYGYYWVQCFGNKVNSDYTTVYDGVDYSSVYNFDYYINKYSDIKKYYGNDPKGALKHFVIYGMNEGRQASNEFNLTYYKNRYADLRNAYGEEWKKFYLHYIKYGKKAGRDAKTYSERKGYVTKYNGVDYSLVFNYPYYVNKYSDIRKTFGDDDIKALKHFVTYGMKGGRQAKAEFNVHYYKSNYADLRKAYGDDLKSYYMHYIKYGKKEGRIASKLLYK